MTGKPITADEDAAAVRARLTVLLRAVGERRDRVAFTEIFTHFAPRVRGYLGRLGATPIEAEEIAQDVMVTVWRRAELFDPAQASASTWIFTIARNRRIDAIRRQRRPDFDPNDPIFVPDPEPAPDAALQTATRENRLHAALKDLSDDQRALLQQAFFAGKSHSEIAAATKLPLGTVKSRLRLAFVRLRKALEGDV
ncbi:ECF RNA polymerase sigma factor RpoE [Alphaproteobacteria bacterium SO-S41]|nr:ECF RNA polymerase sigma factor RpoE [Alphaproteobacteria bacterium SO-S41]